MAKEEYWCHNPEVLLHRRRLVRYLSIVIDATPNGRWTTVGTGSLHFFCVKFVVQKALEACPRWCYAKPEAVIAAASGCRACYSGTVRTCRALTDGQLGFASCCELA